MIFGEYPCCDGELNLSMPEKTPTFGKEECPHCGATVWHKFSRIDPKSWTEEQFLEMYDVNEDTYELTEKGTKQ